MFIPLGGIWRGQLEGIRDTGDTTHTSFPYELSISIHSYNGRPKAFSLHLHWGGVLEQQALDF